MNPSPMRQAHERREPAIKARSIDLGGLRRLLPARNTIGEVLYIGITKRGRCRGSLLPRAAGRPTAIGHDQGGLIGRQLAGQILAGGLVIHGAINMGRGEGLGSVNIDDRDRLGRDSSLQVSQRDRREIGGQDEGEGEEGEDEGAHGGRYDGAALSVWS